MEDIRTSDWNPVTLLGAGVAIYLGSMFGSSQGIVIILCGIAVAAVVLPVGLVRFAARTLKTVPLLLIFLVINMIASGQASAIWQFGALESDALRTSALFTSRVLVMVASGILLAMVHPPQVYAATVARALSGITGMRPIGRRLESALSLSLMFVPFIHSERDRVQLAIAARGFESPRRSLHKRLFLERRLLLPVIVGAVRRADHVAEALTLRGFDPGKPRSYFRKRCLHLRDVVLLSGAVSIAILSLAL